MRFSVAEGVTVEHPAAWLHGIAVNVARNRTRSLRRSFIDAVALPDCADPSMDGLEVVGECFRKALGRLADEHAAVLILSESEGWDMKQVATLLSCSLATAYRHLATAQQQLAATVRAETLVPDGSADEAR